MGRGRKGRKTTREYTVYNGRVPVTDENGNVQTVRGTRRSVSRQQRNGVFQQTVLPDGSKLRTGRNGSMTRTGGNRTITRNTNQVVATNGNGNEQTVRGTRQSVSRQQRNGVFQQTVLPDGSKLQTGRNGSMTRTGGNRTITRNTK